MTSQSIEDIILNETQFSNGVHEQLIEINKKAELFADQGQELHGKYDEVDASYVMKNENDRLQYKIQHLSELEEALTHLIPPDTHAMQDYHDAFDQEQELLLAKSEAKIQELCWEAIMLGNDAMIAQWDECEAALQALVVEARQLLEDPATETYRKDLLAAYNQSKNNFIPVLEMKLTPDMYRRVMAIIKDEPQTQTENQENKENQENTTNHTNITPGVSA